MSKRKSDEKDIENSKAAKKEEIAIDSELLGQQSSYSDKKDEDDLSAAETAEAVAAAAAVAASDGSGHQQQQQQQQQQHSSLQSHLAYQNAFRSSPGSQTDGHHLHSTSPPFQPTTLPPVNNGKPLHGTDEWHRQRRENHKEVERRRRESINYGIKELAALVPTPDTNKAQILQRAVEYIKRLKDNENNNIEKWTLEKLLTEQAVSELSASNDKLKQELERAYREIEHWKEIARANEKKNEQ